jgi:N-acetylmuramoyl-L-alanine amidase
VKIVNKKKFALSCIFFILIIVAITGFFKDTKEEETKQGLATSNGVLAISDKLGSIKLNEDNYYKTYVISCRRDMNDVKWQESKDWYKVSLTKADINNLNINVGDKGIVKDVYYEETSKGITLYIRKSFEKGNSLKTDKLDGKRIIVTITKSNKVYKYKIVVDAGHGGTDKGANFGKLYEKDITLKIAKYIEEYLKNKDCQVILTRDSDEFIYLNSIAELNNNASPDIFISIHIDSNKDIKCKGVSTYYYYNEAGYQKDERIKLANAIQKELIKDDNWNGLGLKKDHLLVLSKSTAVCALVECGFLSNSQDRAKLTNDDVLKRLAKNISQGALEYLNK